MWVLLACVVPPELRETGDTADTAPVDPTAGWVGGEGPTATVSGRAFLFGPAPGQTLTGATVSVLEAPEQRGVVAEDGTFALEVASGAALSFVLEQEGLATIQSATIPIGPEGLDDLGFQVPTPDIVELMALAAEVDLDADACQLVTTVSSAASPPYGGAGVGEPDAIVTLSPALPDDATGPVYFDYLSDSLILPDPALTATTIDGGVIYGNLPTGEWTLHAEKVGVTFTEPVARCHPGAIVNAAPPHGVEVVEG